MTRYIYDEYLKYRGTRDEIIEAKFITFRPISLSLSDGDLTYARYRQALAAIGIGLEANEMYYKAYCERCLSPGAIHARWRDKSVQ